MGYVILQKVCWCGNIDDMKNGWCGNKMNQTNEIERNISECDENATN